jgi:hypothetical protein
MINGQIENVYPATARQMKKYSKKVVDLSKVFYVSEYPKHLSSANGDDSIMWDLIVSVISGYTGII